MKRLALIILVLWGITATAQTISRDSTATTTMAQPNPLKRKMHHPLIPIGFGAATSILIIAIALRRRRKREAKLRDE